MDNVLLFCIYLCYSVPIGETQFAVAGRDPRIDAIEPADVARVSEAIIWDQEVAFAAMGPNLKTVGDMNHLRRGTYWNRL